MCNASIAIDGSTVWSYCVGFGAVFVAVVKRILVTLHCGSARLLSHPATIRKKIIIDQLPRSRAMGIPRILLVAHFLCVLISCATASAVPCESQINASSAMELDFCKMYATYSVDSTTNFSLRDGQARDVFNTLLGSIKPSPSNSSVNCTEQAHVTACFDSLRPCSLDVQTQCSNAIALWNLACLLTGAPAFEDTCAVHSSTPPPDLFSDQWYPWWIAGAFLVSLVLLGLGLLVVVLIRKIVYGRKNNSVIRE